MGDDDSYGEHSHHFLTRKLKLMESANGDSLGRVNNTGSIRLETESTVHSMNFQVQKRKTVPPY